MTLMRVIDREGVEHSVEGSPGLKVMEVLREDYGLAALCGGNCSCATCHVYLDPQWTDRVTAPSAEESELISGLAHRSAQSRLSCQILVTDALAGVQITIAPEE